MEAKRKAQGKAKPHVARMAPINLAEEQAKFFESGFSVDPVFSYREGLDLLTHLERFKVQDKYLSDSEFILESVLEEFKSESQYFAQDGGQLLDEAETKKTFEDYLAMHGIGGNLEITFSSDAIAPTSIYNNRKTMTIKILVSLPIMYRTERVKGVMHHEIGTHLVRSLNERCQVWHRKRKLYGLKPYTETEEGLACLHTQLEAAWNPRRKPYLWSAAMHYYSSYYASCLSFVQLFHKLERYIDDPLRRWKQCVRVKRGIVDTAKAGGCYKDQVYLQGACNVLRQRREVDFTILIAGRLTLEDHFRPEIRRRAKTDCIVLPCFMREPQAYMAALDNIALVNGL